MPQRDQYFLGQSPAEQERLCLQAEELAQDANLLFDRIGVARGWRAVELGCGPGGCLDILSRKVGPGGSVVGVEINADAVSRARGYLADQNVENVEVVQADGKATGLPRGSFDLAFARLLLLNVPEPERIVGEMVALAKSGGVVAFHEADWGLRICDPPHAAFDLLLRVFMDYANANGMDFFIGTRLPRMLRDAGLGDVQVNPIVHVFPSGNPMRTFFLQFAENLRDRIQAQGLISKPEFDEAVAAVKQRLENPDTLLLFPLYIQAWGRKP